MMKGEAIKWHIHKERETERFNVREVDWPQIMRDKE